MSNRYHPINAWSIAGPFSETIVLASGQCFPEARYPWPDRYWHKFCIIIGEIYLTKNRSSER